jgi:multidrug resistance efflux pump
VIPAGSIRSLKDPFEDKAAKRRQRLTLLLILLLVGAWLGYNLWAAPYYQLQTRLWPWTKKVEVAAPATTPSPATPAPVAPTP